MKYGLLFAILIAAPVFGDTKVKIATVPNQFTPFAGPGLPEPVSLGRFYFEVEKETQRARVVVEYNYRNEAMYGSYDGHRPEPTHAQLPGLVYDASNKTVVYRQGTEHAVCGVVRDNGSVETTGDCVISAANTAQVKDDGWKLNRFHALEVFFETGR